MDHALELDREALASFCRRHGVRRLAVFGSLSRGEGHPGSDVDLLVEFHPARTPGLIRMAGMELELARLLGREVELRTYEDLSPHFRDAVRAVAAPIYDAA